MATKRSETPEQREKRLAYHKEYSEKNREKLKAWRDANRKHLTDYRRMWRREKMETDPEYAERQREYRLKYKEENRELVSRMHNEWYKNNPEARQRKNSRRRAKVLNCEINDLTKDQWVSIAQEYLGYCSYCCNLCDKVTLDHLTPLAKGGNNTVSNVVPACFMCNSTKSDSTDWIPLRPDEVVVHTRKLLELASWMSGQW